MGVAPGIRTQFWLYDPQDFCADLKNWTTHLLSDKAPPLVTSVSYGWQGNLSGIGCHMPDVTAVDTDFQKLAAKGITIIFASGDSGSGYSPNMCGPGAGKADTEIVGTADKTMKCFEAQQCCEESQQKYQGYTFTMPGGHGPPPSPQTCMVPSPGKKDEALTGTAAAHLMMDEPQECCDISIQQGVGWTYTPGKGKPGQPGSKPGNCTIFKAVTGTKKSAKAISGRNAKRVEGTCKMFMDASKTKPVKGAMSGGAAFGKKPTLYPSWPASSPWVTAVGATRFVGQKVGNEEMATDQFGSGGGFSSMFMQSPNAVFQTAVIDEFVQAIKGTGLPTPPAGAVNYKGRGTADVSALGEGFQVMASGRVEGVGGTSASAPTFAGLVSLLNEARIQGGMKPLGFLNPWIYKTVGKKGFTDITKGSNAIGRGNGPIKYGWNCTVGWDPATGMGTPKFEVLLKAATGGGGPPSPPGKSVCDKEEFCCPDAKHCLKATKESCLSKKCKEASDVCCPLTKLCVKVKKACTPPAACKKTEYWCAACCCCCCCCCCC